MYDGQSVRFYSTTGLECGPTPSYHVHRPTLRLANGNSAMTTAAPYIRLSTLSDPFTGLLKLQGHRSEHILFYFILIRYIFAQSNITICTPAHATEPQAFSKIVMRPYGLLCFTTTRSFVARTLDRTNKLQSAYNCRGMLETNLDSCKGPLLLLAVWMSPQEQRHQD